MMMGAHKNEDENESDDIEMVDEDDNKENVVNA